jgi:catechol 2,3-dioxygenase-like lactoylglutathione lyase family enzyme
VRIAGLELPVHDLEQACEFYCDALGFTRVAEHAGAMELEIGGTQLLLRRANGRSMPARRRSHDRWFRHLAVSVRTMSIAYARLCERSVPFVSEPVRLPHWNRAAAGIVAAYLWDPEGHPVELIEFPPDKGHDDVEDADRPIYLGIDHTAIVVADASLSETFYRARYGLEVESRSHNFGIEQARLSGLDDANVCITSLRGDGGIGLELLEYLAPPDGNDAPADTSDDDLWSGVTCFASGNTARIDWGAPPLADPDLHRVRP